MKNDDLSISEHPRLVSILLFGETIFSDFHTVNFRVL